MKKPDMAYIDAELANNRPTSGALSTTEVAEALAATGFSDPVDEQLYRQALRRYEAEVARLGATARACAAIKCPLDEEAAVTAA